jgi:hypothetical protein
MKLSAKATRFVIEALECYQKHHDQQLQQHDLSEEDVADLVNDRQYLEAIKQDFEKYRDELMEQRKPAAPGSSYGLV